MKKRITLIVTSLLLTSVLVACGSSESADADATTPVTFVDDIDDTSEDLDSNQETESTTEETTTEESTTEETNTEEPTTEEPTTVEKSNYQYAFEGIYWIENGSAGYYFDGAGKMTCIYNGEKSEYTYYVEDDIIYYTDSDGSGADLCYFIEGDTICFCMRAQERYFVKSDRDAFEALGN